MPVTEATRIVIVAPDTLVSEPGDDAAAAEIQRSRSLHIALLEAGYNIVAVLPVDTFLPDRLHQLQPEMIIGDAESHVRDAIAAGVTAYVVAGLAPERVKPVLEVAQARFAYEETMRRELAEARGQLAERKVVDRAKGLLMQRHQIGEPEAYARIRKA